VRVRRLLVFCLLLSVPLGAAQAALASSGQILHAYADPSFIEGSLAGLVRWTDCGDRCVWMPSATVQPATAEYGCTGNEFFDQDPNTRPVWYGGQLDTNGSAGFDLAHVAIIPGLRNQRLCISVVEKLRVQDPTCLIGSPGRGEDPTTRPRFDRFVPHVLATQLLSVRPTAPAVRPAPASARPPALGPVLSRTAAERSAKRALARRFGRRWRHGARKRVGCMRVSRSELRCGAAWRYGRRRLHARVRVRRIGHRLRTHVVLEKR
jgi:hypothetical protein